MERIPFRPIHRLWTSFRVDPWNSRDNVEQRVRGKLRMDRVDLAQLSGQVTNPADPYTTVRRRGYQTRHVRQNRHVTVTDRAKWRAKLEDHSGVGHAG